MALVEDKAISEVDARSARGDSLRQMDHGSKAYRTAKMDVTETARQVQPDVRTIVTQMLHEAHEKEELVRKEAREETRWIQSEAHAADGAAWASYCHQEGADKDQNVSKARRYQEVDDKISFKMPGTSKAESEDLPCTEPMNHYAKPMQAEEDCERTRDTVRKEAGRLHGGGLKHESVHGFLSSNEWKNIFLLPRTLPVDNKTKDLEYKIIMRFIPTNYLLHKMGKVNSKVCSFCNIEPETIEHLFFNCIYVKNIWLYVFQERLSLTRSCHIPDVRSCVLGVNNEVEHSRALNTIMLLLKSFIMNCK